MLAPTDGALGSHLTKSITDCAAVAAARGRGTAPSPPAQVQRPSCGNGWASAGRLVFGDIQIAQLVPNLGGILQRVVVDRTGLTGTFDVDLAWTPDQMPQRPARIGDGPIPFGGESIDPNRPSLFTAIQEQLGLKLVPTRGPVDVLVIDRVEQPMED